MKSIPKIVIELSGGLVENVFSTTKVETLVIDEPLGADPDELTLLEEYTTPMFVRKHPAEIKKDFTEKCFLDFDKKRSIETYHLSNYLPEASWMFFLVLASEAVMDTKTESDFYDIERVHIDNLEEEGLIEKVSETSFRFTENGIQTFENLKNLVLKNKTIKAE